MINGLVLHNTYLRSHSKKSWNPMRVSLEKDIWADSPVLSPEQ